LSPKIQTTESFPTWPEISSKRKPKNLQALEQVAKKEAEKLQERAEKIKAEKEVFTMNMAATETKSSSQDIKDQLRVSLTNKKILPSENTQWVPVENIKWENFPSENAKEDKAPGVSSGSVQRNLQDTNSSSQSADSRKKYGFFYSIQRCSNQQGEHCFLHQRQELFGETCKGGFNSTFPTPLNN